MDKAIITVGKCFDCPYNSGMAERGAFAGYYCEREQREILEPFIERPDWCSLPMASGYIMPEGHLVNWEDEE